MIIMARTACFIVESVTPQKEAFFAKGIALMGKNKHPIECICQRTERENKKPLSASKSTTTLCGG